MSAPSDLEMFNSRHVPDWHSWSVYNSDPRDGGEGTIWAQSSLIPSGISAPSEETRHTFTNRNFVYFPFFVPSHPADSLSPHHLLEISSSAIRLDVFWSCYSVHLIQFRKLRCQVRLRIVQQSSCIINEDTQHPAHCGLQSLFKSFQSFTKLRICFRNCSTLYLEASPVACIWYLDWDHVINTE